MSKEAKDLILYFATLLFLLQAGLSPSYIFAVGCYMAFVKEWDKE